MRPTLRTHITLDLADFELDGWNVNYNAGLSQLDLSPPQGVGSTSLTDMLDFSPLSCTLEALGITAEQYENLLTGWVAEVRRKVVQNMLTNAIVQLD